LTAAEKSRFVAAVLSLKASGKYDTYVQVHLNAHHDAHRGPAFFPWHREFLRRFELDLQAIDPGVTLPYWNWTVDNSPTSSLWDPAFLGGNGRPSDGQVMTGPFAFATGNWPLAFDGPALRRRFGISAPALPTPGDVTSALAESLYDVAPWTLDSPSGFRNRAEGWIAGPQLHNLVHVWVGGSMGPMSSPNDPVFFLHHCYVDKLWADWQRLHPTAGYLPVSDAMPGHNLGDAMQPWAGLGETITPASRLDHHALGYAYDTEPECGTLKFIDDPVVTIKFRDDQGTLKFIEDNPVTLKFRDDQGTIKFIEDNPVTLKFNDDPGTFKFIEDNQGTVKAIDDVKQPAFDPPIQGGKFQTDPIGQPVDPTINLAAPFVLATPHHSMAWAQHQPAALQAAVKQLETELTQFATAIAEREQAEQQGALTADESQQLTQLRRDQDALLREYRQLVQIGGGGGC